MVSDNPGRMWPAGNPKSRKVRGLDAEIPEWLPQEPLDDLVLDDSRRDPVKSGTATLGGPSPPEFPIPEDTADLDEVALTDESSEEVRDPVRA